MHARSDFGRCLQCARTSAYGTSLPMHHAGEGDEEGIDVVNVHAPSGTPKLTDAQRIQLIRNLLQSSSMTRANRPIGEGRFLIGGDMNTDEIPLGQILDKLQGQGILKTNVEVMVPHNGKHGDISWWEGSRPPWCKKVRATTTPCTYHMASPGENNHSMLQSS